MFRSKIARIAARAFFVAVHRQDGGATAMAPGGPEPVACTLRNTASATCYFLPLRAKPSLLRRMDLPIPSLSEDEDTGLGNTLEKESKDCQRLSKRHGPNLRKVLPTNFRS